MYGKDKFGLFFSMPLNERDWSNLEKSGTKVVMLVLGNADAVTLSRVRSTGASVVLRVPEGQYQDPGALVQRVQAASRAATIRAVIVGNEPDSGAVLSRGEPSWGQDQAFAHRARFNAARRGLQTAGFRVVSPGLAGFVRFPDGHVARSISEDDPPASGLTTWREILCALGADGQFGANSADGNGYHLYCYSWAGVADLLRLKLALKEAEKDWHRPLWVDELGVSSAPSQEARMADYVDISKLLETHPYGAIVEFLCPFVSNGDPGNPPVWDPRYLLTDPVAYDVLGAHLKS